MQYPGSKLVFMVRAGDLLACRRKQQTVSEKLVKIQTLFRDFELGSSAFRRILRIFSAPQFAGTA